MLCFCQIMLSFNDWDLLTKTHSCLIFGSVLITETQNSYMFWHTFFTSSKPLTSIFRIFILQLPRCCKPSPDSSSLRMHVKCIVPAFSLTPVFADAMNCGLLPEITVAWTPKPFPSLKISTKKGILSPALHFPQSCSRMWDVPVSEGVIMLSPVS